MPSIAELAMSIEPGSMFYCTMFDEQREKEAIALVVRERKELLMTLPLMPTLEVRCAAIRHPLACVVHLMLKIGGSIYDSFWNYYRGDMDGGDLFRTAGGQPGWTICFFSEAGVERILCTTQNGTAIAFSLADKIAREMGPWSMAAFDQAKADVMILPPEQLWEQMGFVFQARHYN